MKSSKAFNKRYFEKLPVGLIILLMLFAAALFLCVYIIHEVLWEKEEQVDHYIFRFLSSNIISPRLTGVMEGVTYLASATFLQICYTALVLLYLVSKNWKRSVEIAAIGIGGFLVNYLMKISFKRIRPPDPLIDRLQNFSFPSGHATSGFIFYGLLAYLVWKTTIPKPYKYMACITLILLSVLIGFSRVYLRVHYTTDVLAGFCIGFAWLFLTIALFERLKRKSGNELKHQKV